MFWQNKKNLLIIFLIILSAIGLAAKAESNSITANNAFGYFFGSAQKTAEQMGYVANTTDGTSLLLIKVAALIGCALRLVGVIFLILMVYGGITWMTASGNDKSVEKAKGTISRAAIGLIIVILAYAITLFVINRL